VSEGTKRKIPERFIPDFQRKQEDRFKAELSVQLQSKRTFSD
jgi:hypothetical protein